MKSVLLGYLLIFCTSVYALVPVEGILMGEANTEYQQDPLQMVFRDTYDKGQEGENAKIKSYQRYIQAGQYLDAGCSLAAKPTFDVIWKEKQAKRSVAATLQYIGLDLSIKAIGAYASRLEMNDSSYKKLTKNIVQNYCSKNVTVYSLKRIEQALDFYYKKPIKEMIPSVDSSPFVTTSFKKITESTLARSNEFDQAINNFKAFCSWGGDSEDYRLLSPYLKNSTIMSYVTKSMAGYKDTYDNKRNRFAVNSSSDTVQVSCTDLICRKVSFTKFKNDWPASIGSTGILPDLVKLYCHHFKNTEYANNKTIPQVKEWIKKFELEDPIFETSFFISLMTGVPDPIFGVEEYRDLPALAKSSIDDRWNSWSNQTLNLFSKDMLFEESLKIQAVPQRDNVALRTDGFLMNFAVTLGEMDRITDDSDKLALSFDLSFSKNDLRQIKSKWIAFNNAIDPEGMEAFTKEVAKRVDAQLKAKEKLFQQKMWTDDFSRLIVQELIGQLNTYQGPLFKSYQDEMIKVPVKFSYGVFAISYLRYRADVKDGRLKLNL